jgi:hypothetical protein
MGLSYLQKFSHGFFLNKQYGELFLLLPFYSKIKMMKTNNKILPRRPYGLPPFESPEGWAIPAKVTHLIKGSGDNKYTVGIRVETNSGKFTIPVIDVRRNRDAVERMEKAAQRGSKYFNPSYSITGHSYNVSRK